MNKKEITIKDYQELVKLSIDHAVRTRDGIWCDLLAKYISGDRKPLLNFISSLSNKT